MWSHRICQSGAANVIVYRSVSKNIKEQGLVVQAYRLSEHTFGGQDGAWPFPVLPRCLKTQTTMEAFLVHLKHVVLEAFRCSFEGRLDQEPPGALVSRNQHTMPKTPVMTQCSGQKEEDAGGEYDFRIDGHAGRSCFANGCENRGCFKVFRCCATASNSCSTAEERCHVEEGSRGRPPVPRSLGRGAGQVWESRFTSSPSRRQNRRGRVQCGRTRASDLSKTFGVLMFNV